MDTFYGRQSSLQTPIKKRPLPATTTTPPTIDATQTQSRLNLRDNWPSSILKTQDQPLKQQQKQEKQEQKEVAVAYAWDTINYRESKYIGKVIYTKCTSLPPQHPLPHFNMLVSSLGGHMQQYRQYKHGPGLLQLDANLWVIASWHYDQIHSTRFYVITPDLGLMELRLKGKTHGASGLPKTTGQIDVQQIRYIGTGAKCPGRLKNYMIVGARSGQGAWKWRANLQGTADTTKNEYLQLKSQQAEGCPPNSLMNKVTDWKLVQSRGKREKQSRLDNMPSFGSYSEFIDNIAGILIDTVPINQKQEGFRIQQQESKVTRNMGVPPFSGTTPQLVTNIQTKIQSRFNKGESIHIRLNTQASEGTDWTAFHITEVAVRRNAIRNKQALQVTLEYLYQVKQIAERRAKDGTPLLPEIEVQQKTSNDSENRYRHRSSYNIFTRSPSDLLADCTQDYHLARKQKSNGHLRSLNFHPNSHTGLTTAISNVLLNIQTIYYQVLQLDHQRTLKLDGSSEKDRLTSLMKPTSMGRLEHGRNRSLESQQRHRYNQMPQANLQDLKKELQRIQLKSKYTQLKKQISTRRPAATKLNKTFVPTYNKLHHSLSHDLMPHSLHHDRSKLVESLYTANNGQFNPTSPKKQKERARVQSSLNRIVQERQSQQEKDHLMNVEPDQELVNLTIEYGGINKLLVEESMKNKIPLQIRQDECRSQFGRRGEDGAGKNYGKLRQELGCKTKVGKTNSTLSKVKKYL